MMRSYMQALDAQVDLIRFWKGPYGTQIGEYWVDTLLQKGISFGSPALFAAREMVMLDRADTYWVSPTMVKVIDDQRSKLPAYELRSSDIPSRNGFAFLGSPIYIKDRYGRRCNLQAFSWSVEPMIVATGQTQPTPLAVPLSAEETEEVLASDVPIPREDGTESIKAVRFFVYSDGRDEADEGWGDADDPDVERSIKEVRENLPCRWSLFHVETWRLNQALPEPVNEEYGGAEPFLRVVATFWTMCNQKIVVTGSMDIDKHARRRSERWGHEPHDVKVVVLRREYEKNTWEKGESPGEGQGYSHAFWVRGHLRNQWYPSEDRHKPIWIEPFIKGEGPPEDKDVVFTMTR